MSAVRCDARKIVTGGSRDVDLGGTLVLRADLQRNLAARLRSARFVAGIDAFLPAGAVCDPGVGRPGAHGLRATARANAWPATSRV